ncbi:hypothetical protein NKH77_05180 [Streptomyces sp. M19]
MTTAPRTAADPHSTARGRGADRGGPMTAFLGTLGTRLTDRWPVRLLAPGLLYVAVATTGGYALGQGHWHEPARLWERLNAAAASPVSDSAGALALVVAGVLVASAAAGLAAEVAGRIAEWWWLGSWHGPLSGRWPGGGGCAGSGRPGGTTRR